MISYDLFFLNFINIKTIITTIANTVNIPKLIPALKISVTTVQELKVEEIISSVAIVKGVENLILQLF